MNIYRIAATLAAVFPAALCTTTVQAEQVRVPSPDGHLVFTLDIGETLSYSVDYEGMRVISPSDMGFRFKDEEPMGSAMELVSPAGISLEEESWTPVVRNRHAHVHMQWNQAVARLREKGALKRKMDVEIRVFNEGVAFRYHLYGNETLRTRQVTEELTQFAVPASSHAYVAEYPSRYTSSQEAEFFKRPVTEMTEETLGGLPLLVEIDKSHYLAITEAYINDWPGFYIGGGDKLHTMLSPLPGEPEEGGTKARFDDEAQTPWRVIMAAGTPGRFIESELVRTLNPPCAIEDTSWIKPGLCAWDHWWSGEVKMETDVIKQYIDLAAEEGWPYMLIDWQWYGPYNRSDADIVTPAPQLDFPGILSYAKEKGVRIWLWMYSSDVNRNDAYKTAFEQYEKWGIAGIKIDFMDRDDQYMTNWYRRIISEAARHHLMVDLHGAYKPDGIERTYPNFLTREGVMGNEYNKWNQGISSEHNVKLAFTRMVAGPMDYTPGGFLNVLAKDHKAQSPTLVPNTRCAELSKFVIYESPYTVVCDHPDNILGQAGADFLKMVPTTWDDTRFLQGGPDDYIAIARKNGDTWYIGVMNNSEGREITIDTSFLGDGEYTIEYWADTGRPADVKHKTTKLKKGAGLKIKLAPDGGYVGVVKGSSSHST